MRTEHSFGNYFRTLSAPMARTRWHIMYSTAPWKLHQLRNRCIYFGNRARAMSLNPCTNQNGSGIRITAHLRHMNQCIPHHSIWRHICPTGQTDWQTTQSATVLFVVVERNFVWQQHPLQLLYSSKCHSQKGESMATFKHYVCMLYGWSRLIGLKAIILSNSQNVYQYSYSSLTFEIIKFFEQPTHRNDRKSATKLCDYYLRILEFKTDFLW